MQFSLYSKNKKNWGTQKALSHLMTKPTKWLWAQRRLRSAWASAQSDQSLRCPRKESWFLSYPVSAQRRLWSDWADAEADLSLRWAHSHFVDFVMRRLISAIILKFYQLLYHIVLMCPKDGDRMASSVDHDETSSLIWVYTVCRDLFVRKLRIITVVVKTHDIGSF